MKRKTEHPRFCQVGIAPPSGLSGCFDSPQKLGAGWYCRNRCRAPAVARTFKITSSLILSIVNLKLTWLELTFMIMFGFILMAADSDV